MLIAGIIRAFRLDQTEMAARGDIRRDVDAAARPASRLDEARTPQ